MTRPSLVQIAFRFDRHHWRPKTAFLCAVGVAIPLLVPVWLGHPEWGILSGLGALYTGLASFGGVQPARIRRMLAHSVVTAATTYVGSLISTSHIATIATVLVASFVLAVIGARSVGANTIAVQTVAVLVVLSGLPEFSANPLGNAGLVLAGGLVQIALLSLIGPVYRTYEQRKAVADAYRTLAHFAEARLDTPGDPDGREVGWSIPDAQPFQDAQQRLDEAESFGLCDEIVPLRRMLSGAETMRAALVGFARAYAAECNQGLLERAWAESVAQHVALAFDRMAEAISEGRYGHPFAIPLEDDGGRMTSSREEVIRWVELINQTFDELGIVPPETRSSSTRQRFGVLRGWLKTFTGLIDSRSLQRLAVGHGLRYALAVAGATAAYRLLHIQHGYWFPLTIAIILRADYATTLTRGLARLAGTLAAVLLATVVGLTLHPSHGVMLGIMLVATWCAFALFLANYFAYSFSLTLYVVYSVSAAGAHESVVGIERLQATILGILVTLVTAWLWPIWQSTGVKDVLADAFRHQVAYAEAVRQLLQGGSREVADQARYHGRALRIESERIVTATSLEPVWAHKKRLHSAQEYLASLDENAAILLSIHAQAIDPRPHSESTTKDLDDAEQTARALLAQLSR